MITEKQKEALKHNCPHCETGRLHEVENVDNNESLENNLWCNNCDLSMDGSGGYTC